MRTIARLLPIAARGGHRRRRPLAVTDAAAGGRRRGAPAIPGQRLGTPGGTGSDGDRGGAGDDDRHDDRDDDGDGGRDGARRHRIALVAVRGPLDVPHVHGRHRPSRRRRGGRARLGGRLGGRAWDVAAGTSRAYTLADGLPSLRISSVAVAGDGTVWVGTRGAGAARLGGDGAWHALSFGDGPWDDDVLAIAPDPDGSVWFGTGAGASRLRRTAP
ncbi:MAG: two-component regulator propeller domain-containing protein [Anaerolineae bacterium]